jgi:hypothetical protein
LAHFQVHDVLALNTSLLMTYKVSKMLDHGIVAIASFAFFGQKRMKYTTAV